MTSLKLCPFCGSTASPTQTQRYLRNGSKVVYDVRIECDYCHASTRAVVSAVNPAEKGWTCRAVDDANFLWNERI